MADTMAVAHAVHRVIGGDRMDGGRPCWLLTSSVALPLPLAGPDVCSPCLLPGQVGPLEAGHQGPGPAPVAVGVACTAKSATSSPDPVVAGCTVWPELPSDPYYLMAPAHPSPAPRPGHDTVLQRAIHEHSFPTGPLPCAVPMDPPCAHLCATVWTPPPPFVPTKLAGRPRAPRASG